MESKTMLELLRELSGKGCRRRARLLGAECGDFKNCQGCPADMRNVFGLLADKLEAEQRAAQLPEGVEWPRFEDGELVRFCDAYEMECGDVAEVRGIKIMGTGNVVINPQALEQERRLFVRPGERVKRPKPQDTQEAINDDATMPAATYCVRHGLVESDTDVDECTLLELHINDLLRRQRELCESERG